MIGRVFCSVSTLSRSTALSSKSVLSNGLCNQGGQFARFGSRSFSTGPENFQILGIQQIAIGGLDKKLLSSLWVDTFGLKKVGEYVAESENVDEDILSLGNGPYAVEVDLMQPLDPNKAPKVHSPPLNHIGK